VLPSLVCLVKAPGKGTPVVKARVMLDSGAENSFITYDMLERAKVTQGATEIEQVHGIGGKTSSLQTSDCVVILKSVVSTHSMSFQFRAINTICSDLPPFNLAREDIPDPSNLQLTEKLPRGRSPVDILIGEDYFADFLTGNISFGGKDQKILFWNTLFGTAISGYMSGGFLAKTSSLMQSVSEQSVESLNNMLKRFWDWETIGIRDEKDAMLSPNEIYALEHFNSHVKFDGARYTVSLPFNPDKPKPHNNHNSAVGQFRSLERSLERNPQRCELYTAAIMQYINLGHAELVNSHSPECDAVSYTHLTLPTTYC
jgi:hypothetical protein